MATSLIPSVVAKTVNMDSVISNPNIPKIYANGFIFGHSFTDVAIIFQQGSTSVASITMAFATLKSLNKSLNDLIAQIEKGVGHPIADIHETMKEWQKNIQEKESQNKK
jgi:hypothetical protein